MSVTSYMGVRGCTVTPSVTPAAPISPNVAEEKRVKQDINESRRRLLKKVTLGVALLPVAAASLRTAGAADAPLVTEDDPTAKALKYVSDASKATGAKPGSHCGNCALYQGGAAAQGGCLLFPGKSVKSAGWCSSWAPKPA
jgi:High potential iron-sulfur protein